MGLASSAVQDDTHVILLLYAPAHRPVLPQGVLASLFGLTPTETHIAMALLEGSRAWKDADNSAPIGDAFLRVLSGP